MLGELIQIQIQINYFWTEFITRIYNYNFMKNKFMRIGINFGLSLITTEIMMATGLWSSQLMPIASMVSPVQKADMTSTETLKMIPALIRVLNANFFHVKDNKSLATNGCLIANEFYELRVDIGPSWINEISIVSGDARFPEEFLPQDKEGFLIHVIFISKDLSVNSSADMWVPTQSGQSFPFIEGKRAEKPGPVIFPIYFRELKNAVENTRALGRLYLYYGDQVLQSAIISVGVTNKPSASSATPNQIVVDYSITSDYQQVEKRLGKRRIKLTQKDVVDQPVVSIALDDAGTGRKGFLVTHPPNGTNSYGVKPIFIPYRTEVMKQKLDEFRNVLSGCYKNLTPSFGKTKRQFYNDLLKLVRVGNELRNLIIPDQVIEPDNPGSILMAYSGNDGSRQSINRLFPEDKIFDVSYGDRWTTVTGLAWWLKLKPLLANAGVIQIARTGKTDFVFPWAIVYEYPMDDDEKKYNLCPVVEDEWNAEGVREKDPDLSCPYKDEAWHQQNIVCPYGFWGLKHIIEQPPAAIMEKAENNWVLHDVSNKVIMSDEFSLSIGVTDDIDHSTYKGHIDNLRVFSRLKPQDPARDRDSALNMLRSPEIVYFLCHGDVDTNKTDYYQTTYLNIGKRDGAPQHKIYPSTLLQWGQVGGPDMTSWIAKRPLIFINGCHTTDLTPGVALNFVSTFSQFHASGVIGTEVSVQADMATEIAEAILRRISEGQQVGQAIREMRWELVNKGNILGLAYTAYCLADLHVERQKN